MPLLLRSTRLLNYVTAVSNNTHTAEESHWAMIVASSNREAMNDDSWDFKIPHRVKRNTVLSHTNNNNNKKKTLQCTVDDKLPTHKGASWGGGWHLREIHLMFFNFSVVIGVHQRQCWHTFKHTHTLSLHSSEQRLLSVHAVYSNLGHIFKKTKEKRAHCYRLNKYKMVQMSSISANYYMQLYSTAIIV